MDKPHNFWKRTFSSLKIYNYRLYFIGQAVSLCGTWMQVIGQDWLVLKLTNSGTQLGIVSAFQFLPTLLLGPWGGVIADRFNKRKVLYLTQTAAAILALVLGLLVAGGFIQIWMVYVLALALGLVNTVNNPTQQTFVFEMVGQEQLQNAVTLNSTEVNLARAIGPAVSGTLIATVGLAACFIINAVSYIAVLAAFYAMREAELRPSRRVAQIKGQLRQGFRYVRQSAVLLNILIMMAIIGTLSYEFSVILPLVAQFTFHGGAGTYAALVSATGVGSVLGGLYIASRRRASTRLLVLS
ncbi:MAG TPA: MFS transporter, partial [Patescibacteria group bacterium]|nr:MFS transporter [Patescibacteria group bacterium]